MGLSQVVTAWPSLKEESKATFGTSEEKNCKKGLAMSFLDMKEDNGSR